MNPLPESDPGFESLLRQRAARLAAPHPAWRQEILTSVIRPSARASKRAFLGWASLAACWAAIAFLNWDAGRETARHAHYANAQAAAIAMGNSSSAVLLAMSSQ